MGQPLWRFTMPAWMEAEDERGEAVTQGDLAPSDALALGLALTFATMDAAANHGGFSWCPLWCGLCHLAACVAACLPDGPPACLPILASRTCRRCPLD